MMKKNNKGFTLAELLIVVAIIAVLVSIAIPTFTSATDKAAVSADAANIRAAYAEYQVHEIDSEVAPTVHNTFICQSGGKVEAGKRTLKKGTHEADLPAPAKAEYTLTKGSTCTVTMDSGELVLTVS